MALAPVLGGCGWGPRGEAVSSDSLWSSLLAPSNAEERWYAVQTRSRHEKVVAAQLHGHGIHTYLPLVPEVHRWSDRRKVVEVPLFPGYAFIRSVNSAETAAKVVRTDGVVSIVGARPCGTPIPEEEIEAIQRLLTNEISYVNHPFLKIGQRVRVRGGALDGVEGILLERKGETSLVVSIELVQRSLAVHVEGLDFEAI